MSTEDAELAGPDLASGIAPELIPDGGVLAGHAFGKPVMLVRQGDEIFAVGAHCTHYSGPLADGIVVGHTVRCPWHHACFSLRTGEAIRAPALNPISRWAFERRDGLVFVQGEVGARETSRGNTCDAEMADAPLSIVVVGGGAAGDAAADMLRRLGYDGSVTMISADESAPYDRPNLSKDYLAGTAQEEWIPLRPSEFYEERRIRLVLGKRVTAIDRQNKRVQLEDGTSHDFGALLLATGASPVRLPSPIAGGRPLYLRTLADSRAIIAAAERARHAVVIGASFIGLEVSASLRARGVDVHVIAPEQRPLERIMGREVGDFVRAVHEAEGVTFHLGRTASRVDAEAVTLDNGEVIECDLVVGGVGVRPNEELAAAAGLATDRGVVVDEYLETSGRGIFAAGDVARYPDASSGDRIRVEHWVVAQRQGQTAAKNMLVAVSSPLRQRFDTVPFFWSQHYDVSIRYVGHAARWDRIDISGSLAARDCEIRYLDGARTAAVATIGRDRASLEAEVRLETANAR